MFGSGKLLGYEASTLGGLVLGSVFFYLSLLPHAQDCQGFPAQLDGRDDRSVGMIPDSSCAKELSYWR